MTPVQKLASLVVLILVLMASAAGGAWQVQGWRLGKQMSEQLSAQSITHQGQLDAITNEAWRQQKAEQNKRLATEQQIAVQDQQHAQELSNAQRNQAALRDRLATADVRLSVLLDATDAASRCDVPATTCTPGVVHAARRAQLDAAHAQRIIGITGDGDAAIIALKACQSYARSITN